MAKATHKEMADNMKTFLVSMLCVIPLVIIVSLIIGNAVSSFVLILIDCIILVGGSVIGYIIVDKYKERIKQKREEFLKTHPEAEE